MSIKNLPSIAVAAAAAVFVCAGTPFIGNNAHAAALVKPTTTPGPLLVVDVTGNSVGRSGAPTTNQYEAGVYLSVNNQLSYSTLMPQALSTPTLNLG